MKKSMVSLTLLLALLATTGCSESAKAKTWKDEDGVKYDLMYTYGEDGRKTADEVYNDLLDSTAGSKAIFEKAYKKVVQSMIESKDEERNKEIEKEVDEEMVTWLQDAKNQASDNGVSKDTMIDALLEEEGVKSTEELTEKKIYAKQKEYVEETYFDNNREPAKKDGKYELNGNSLIEEYVKEYAPIHVKGILVKLADNTNTYFARSISEDETKKLARTTQALIDGKEFNVLAMDTKYSDHSSSQIESGGDLGIMDATTSFNNEYKLGIYTYFAFKDFPKNGDADALAAWKDGNKALELLTGNDETLINDYIELYKDGFGTITAEQVMNLKGSAELKKNADGQLVNSATKDGDYKSLNLPRNVIYNNYFNSHRVSFLANATGDGVVENKLGYPILVLTDENGVQFISIEMDSFGSNYEAAVNYFGSTEDKKLTLSVNGTEKELTTYYYLGGSANKNSRKETVDSQIKNYINKGYSSSVSANQDYYYFRIFNEWLANGGNTADLYGDKTNFKTQVEEYINNSIAYRNYLIQESKENTGDSFAKTLRLQDSYEDWVRPIELAYYEGYSIDGTALTKDEAKDEFLKVWDDTYNTHLKGGKN